MELWKGEVINMETVLEVENLTKVYNGKKAVDDISLSLKKGEIVGLLGPNGAGKTSTINMILGILEPTAGRIRIFGKDLTEHRSLIMQKVNFAAAYAQLPGNMSPLQNLFIMARLYGVPNPWERAEAALREFGLEKFIHQRTGYLSSGEQSRLNLAKALINEPQLLILDEPTASIDPSASEIMRSKIKEYVARSKAAVLWTSHDMYEITAVCERILFISHGKILLEGNPRELPERYGKKNLEELFIAVAREPLSLT